MTSSALKQLKISYLRGSVTPFELPFEPSKKLTLVYGENGTGKSTICDALDFLGNGKVGSIEDRGLGSLQRFWPSAGKAASDITVVLEVSGGTQWEARAHNNAVTLTPPAGAPPIEILRRGTILSLVTAPPAERYEAIKSFIDVSDVEASEASLRTLIRDLKGNREVAIARVVENEQAIQGFWETAGSSGSDSLTWAKKEAAREPDDHGSEVAALASLRDTYAKLMDCPQRWERTNAAVHTAQETAIAAESKVAESLQTVASDAKEIVAVLQAAKHYLMEHPSTSVCPVCESSEKIQGLQTRVAERLAPFAQLQSAQTGTANAATVLQRARENLETVQDDILHRINAFDSVRASFSWASDVEMPADPAPHIIEDLGAWLGTTAHLPKQWQDVITSRKDKEQFSNALRTAVKTYSENFQAQKELDALLPKLERVLEIVEEERRAFTDDVLSRIAMEVGRLYELVHPGEGLNKISLQLDPKRRASLGMSVEFCGTDGLPPQAYFSDSHLDTLGLCVFLARAAMADPSSKVLVLDDVLGSVDEPHVERVVGMIYEVSEKFRHTIITTHYRPWRERFRWGALKPGRPCQFVELGRWGIADGISLLGCIPEIDRLKGLLATPPLDVQAICSKAGVILEYALDYLTLRYECRVPRRRGNAYTIGDLLPAIDNKLREALKVEIRDGLTDPNVEAVQIVKLKAILDELTRIAQFRNALGAHFKDISFDLLDQDAITFANQVVLLVDALSHPIDGWPNNDKSGSYWQNSGDSRRLHPLKKPA